jgi:hypothetical protein
LPRELADKHRRREARSDGASGERGEASGFC